MKFGFREAQQAVIAALESGEYQHVSRRDIDVKNHVLKRDGWYIKFFFIEPDTWFISVHQ